ncbi:motility associated factor glycosyltransferase family protein [Acetivibrio cellulolyticus]|uniref:motility associated factor glycosyltransferase family protein n=1 Tax=Acetivibrio cellulolyticus TaxID=35830 RepID=UPI0001E2EB64|nr:6-hydroxymethylpterin diphosphokinase MptE-like protein [Acetivibrio cellulolyticus]
MNEVFEKNVRLLAKYQPQLYKKLDSFIKGNYAPKNKSVERILLANQEDLIINILVRSGGKDYVLCDHEDPISEAYAWIDRYVDPANKIDIVFGIGMAFHLEVLITSFCNKRILIIEPNFELFYQILCVRNLDFLIENTEILVDEDFDTILNKISTFFWDTREGGIQLQPFEVYAELFPQLWDDLKNRFIKMAQSFTVDIATKRKFGELWVHNNIKNLNSIKEASNADELSGKFKGVPGILVSAGPSLKKNAHLLKELGQKCVIMAAGTAVTILQDFGVTPHFMMGIDAAEGEGKMHEKVLNKDIYFLYSNQVSTYSIENYEGPKFLMNYPMDLYTYEFFKFARIKSDFFFSGPSVANTCFDMLYKMGCNPIILIGQDLAYTDGSNYANEENGTVSKMIDENKSGYVLLKDIYGKDVYTIPTYLAIKNWFEGYFEKVSDKVEIINATEGGLNIEFVRNDTLSNVIEKNEFKSRDIEGYIKQIFEKGKFNDKVHENVQAYLKYVEVEIDKLEMLSKEQLELVKLIENDICDPKKNKREYERVVTSINELSKKVIDSPIYPSLLKNLIEIEFFLIKAEVDRATRVLAEYKDIKAVFVNAIIEQNRILDESLTKIKGFMSGTLDGE